jgi:hypothetical protein
MYSSLFGLHWDVLIAETMIVLGCWEEALHLIETVQKQVQQSLNPAHHCYTLALKSRLLLLLGKKELSIEAYRDARITRLNLDTPNAIRSFVVLQRLSFDLNMRISSDEDQVSFSLLIIDQAHLQLNYINARAQQKKQERPSKTLPWIYSSLVVDYLLSIHEKSLLKEEIIFFWQQMEEYKIPLLLLWISKIGHEVFQTEIWKDRLKEQIVYCMTKQPQCFQLQEHWLNTHHLL